MTVKRRCPGCGEDITVLADERLAFHYASGPGMGIPCPQRDVRTDEQVPAPAQAAG